jgi:hypothetical protein
LYDPEVPRPVVGTASERGVGAADAARGDAGRLLVPAVAIAGVVVGHLITYAVLVPGPSDRAAVLRDTGHAYFPLALQAALLVGAVSLGSWFLRALTVRDRSPVTTSTLFGRLARLQVAGFAAMEILERVASRTPLIELVRDHVVVGLAVQLLVAWLAARLLAALTRTADRVGHLANRWRPAGAFVSLPALRLRARGRLARRAAAARAPPGLLRAP